MSDERNNNLEWQDGQPLSRRFGDVYFSRASGIDETRHVFLAQNRLAERWASLPAGGHFVIGETGFGTGLNFLCAWQLWRARAPADAALHFVSIEKHPLNADELAQALALWPELASLRDELLRQYREPPLGWHRFRFHGGVTLTLAVGDIADVLPQLDLQADVWFLDGFAPARNPAMWTADVLCLIAERTRPEGSFATYTAAGEVRRSLEAAGFAVERVKGHGTKREMLRGSLREPLGVPRKAPWFTAPPLTSHKRRCAIVVGGGLAGTSAAASLAARGWHVTLIERHARLAAEASGNPQGILYARLSGRATPLRELVISGYCHTLRMLHHFPLNDGDWRQCGLLQLAFSAEEATRQEKLLESNLPSSLFHAVNGARASELSGIDLPTGGLHFPLGGWVDPAALCAVLANHTRIELRLATEALSLEHCNDEWAVHGVTGCIASAPVIVIAGAKDTAGFESTRHLPLKTIRGQISVAPQTSDSARLRAVVCGEAYVAPAHNGQHTLGATHKFEDQGADVRASEHVENLDTLRRLAPALHRALDADALDVATLPGRAGLRVSTPDYLPIIGPLVDAEAFNTTYAALRHDATLAISTPAPWLPGLYVSTGHGSRGLITALLGGEVLASYINEEPAPLSTSVMQAIHPSRFLLRALKRPS